PDLLAFVAAVEADPDLAARLARALAPHIFAAGIAATKLQGKEYSSRAGCAPAGYSREAWRDLARRIGVKRGRYFYVSAAELDTHERGQREPKPANDAPPSTWTPAVAANAMGLRGTR
ncbi:MAG TPA: hypothetical protein VIY73_13035, partial [Polyangiaceae bacterium]